MVDPASKQNPIPANERPITSLDETKPSSALPKTRKFQQYLRDDEELKRLSAAEVDAYEAPEVDDGLEAIFDDIFPSTEAVKLDAETTVEETVAPVVTEEEGIPAKKEIISFDRAKQILVPFINTMQGQVSPNDFEDAYRFFVKLGSNDLEKSYLQEKKAIEAAKRKSQGSMLDQAQLKLRQIQSDIKEGGANADVLSEALGKQGVSAEDVGILADAAEFLDDAAKDAIPESVFSTNFAKIFFFLKEQAPLDMPDGIVFEELAKPLFELIGLRTLDDKDLKKPKRPVVNKGAKPGQVKNQRRKLAAHPKKLSQFNMRLEQSIPEVYTFLVEKLGDQKSAAISQRLEELS